MLQRVKRDSNRNTEDKEKITKTINMSKTKELERPAPVVQTARIPVEVLNDTLQYLATKPYGEVAEFINAIKQNAKIDE